MLVSQLLRWKRLPEPDSSQKMSGLLRSKWLPVTELLVGFAVPPKNGSIATTTPPETGVGPEGTLPERWLAVTSMSVVPRSAMPIPEKFLSNCAARHDRVLFSTVLAFTSKPLTGSLNPSVSKNMPAQLLRTSFPAMKPRLVSATYMPHAPPEMLLPTTFAFADFWPITKVPKIPERLISLERILVPGESTMNTPAQLPMRSFPAMVVSMLSKASIALWPSGMFLTSFFTTVVRELKKTPMPSTSV